jgi:CHAD domain-containing protein
MMAKASHPRPASAVRRERHGPRLLRHRRKITSTTSCETAFCIGAHGCLQDVAANQTAACADDGDALHQMRIALMRLRTLVSFFSPMVSGPEWVRFKRELRWLNSYLSAARDMDVLMVRLKLSGGEDFEAIAKARNRKWAQSHQGVTRALKSKRYERLIQNLSLWIEGGSQTATTSEHRAETIATYSARKLSRWHRKLLKKSRRLDGMSIEELHRLRIATKRLRYATEFFAPLFSDSHPSRQKTILKYLRTAQESLGSLNDAERARSLTAGFHDPSHSPTHAEQDHAAMPDSDKRTQRLINAAAAAYHKLAQTKPPWT